MALLDDGLGKMAIPGFVQKRTVVRLEYIAAKEEEEEDMDWRYGDVHGVYIPPGLLADAWVRE